MIGERSKNQEEHPKPAQKSLKNQVNDFWAQNFPRLRRAQRGFAFEAVLLRPESATLAVTIIRRQSGSGSWNPGREPTGTAPRGRSGQNRRLAWHRAAYLGRP